MYDDDADLIDQVSDDEDMDDATKERARGKSRHGPVDDEPPLPGYTRYVPDENAMYELVYLWCGPMMILARRHFEMTSAQS